MATHAHFNRGIAIASPIGGGGAQPPPQGVFSQILASVMQGNALAAILLLSAIVVGFIHGWMKMRYRSILITFAFDIPLTLSFVVTLLSIRRGRNIFPVHPISSALKLLVGLCTLYGLLPFGLPLLVTLAAFRGWCFIPLIFLLGYHLTRSRQQLDVFVWLLLILGLGTLLYGLGQSTEEVRRIMQDDALIEARFRYQFYATKTGSQLRVFSTFVSSGAFGGVMAFCSLFTMGRMVSSSIGLTQRLILMALFGGLAYGIILSGSRSSLLMLIIGLMLFVSLIRRIRLPVVTVLIIGTVIGMSTIKINDSLKTRFLTLLDPETLFLRVWIVIFPGWVELSQRPLGWGLGRSTHGVPSSLLHLFGRVDWKPIDGDLGKLMVDLGILGVLVLGWLLFVSTREIFYIARDMGSRVESRIVLPTAGWFLASVITVSIGSPFLGIPVGPLIWFFLGACVRLHEIEFGAYGGNKRRLSLLEQKRAEATGEASKDVPMQPPKSRVFLSERTPPPERAQGWAQRFIFSPGKPPADSAPKEPAAKHGHSKVRRLFD